MRGHSEAGSPADSAAPSRSILGAVEKAEAVDRGGWAQSSPPWGFLGCNATSSLGQIGPHSALELGAALSSLPWGCLAFSPPASVSRHVHSHPTQSLASGPGIAMGPEGHESLPTDCQGPQKWSDMVLHISLSKYKSLLCACHMFLPCPPVLSMCACPFHVHVCAVTCICYMSHVPVYNSLPCNTSLCVCMSVV